MGGLHNPVSDKYETILFAPGLKGGVDLEAATKTITAVAEASGVGNADYSSAQTLATPSDARLGLLRIAARLAVTIDSMTATHLYCKVYVDVQDANHLLFSEDFTSTGAKLDAVDTHVTNKATIFNLLKDGAAHTFYFFFWVDSGNAVLSVVQEWHGVGTCTTSSAGTPCMRLDFTGMCNIWAYITKIGTGTASGYIGLNTANPTAAQQTIANSGTIYLVLANGSINLLSYGTVATDLYYYSSINLTLRSVQ